MLGLGLAACGGAAFVTQAELPKQKRRPDGVFVDAPAAVPEAVDRAEAEGVVALREPVPAPAVEQVVRAFFHAFEREDMDALGDLLLAGVVQLDPAGRAGSPRLVEVYRQRIRSVEFQKLVGVDYVRLERMQRLEYDDVPQRLRPHEMQRGDILLRVPLTLPRTGDTFFQDNVVMLLRRFEGKLRIAGVGEEP